MTNQPWFTRSLPFAAYMLFILIAPLVERMLPETISTVWLVPALYLMKILAAGIILILFWKSYDELKMDRFKPVHALAAVGVGVLVFVLWVNMDWKFLTVGTPDTYDPNVLPEKWMYAFIALRIFGASVVVPIFEELFWRSFILRYIIDADFTRVRIGTFTWTSFIVASALFGVEHHFWLAGIVAGVLYTLLLYKTKHITHCIIAHGVTNFILGLYVLKTGNWYFW